MSNTSKWTRIAVTALFAAMYLAFLIETIALFTEFGPSGLAMRIAVLDAQNFIFFPVAGLLALIAFWRPVVMLADAMARGKIKYGRIVLPISLIAAMVAASAVANVFANSNSRSFYEVAPAALEADDGRAETATSPARAPLTEILVKMKIMASGESGLQAYQSRCDEEWLQFSTSANEEKLCFPTGGVSTVAECCRAKTILREDLNALHASNPSDLFAIHGPALTVKCFFLLLLLIVGIMLVRYRQRLQTLYGRAFESVSFGLAIGGAVMLMWPLMNAAYLQTTALLTGDGSSNAYTLFAPLIALGFGIWAMLLVFFHLRSYPSQIEYAAKLGGFVAAAIGVFRYEEIIAYFTRTLGVGGGLLAIIVFAVAVGALIMSVVMGVRPQDLDMFDDDDIAPTKS